MRRCVESLSGLTNWQQRIIGGDDAFMEGKEELNYATSALNCGSVQVDLVGALLNNVEEDTARLKMAHHDAEGNHLAL